MTVATSEHTHSDLLRGHSVLVTGAAGAIGAAISRSLECHGARVVRTDRRAGEGVLALDACDERSVAEGFSAAGPITDVVHAAGTLIIGPIADTALADARVAIDNNIVSALLVGREAARRLGPGGSITIISSQASYRAGANWGVYCAVKAAVSRLSEALAQELAPKGIRVNAVCPGTVETPMLDDASRQLARIRGTTFEVVNEGYRATNPMGRLAKVREIGDVCVFLTSPLASYVSGASIPVDGGEISA